jgi:hypothetical protein
MPSSKNYCDRELDENEGSSEPDATNITPNTINERTNPFEKANVIGVLALTRAHS